MSQKPTLQKKIKVARYRGSLKYKTALYGQKNREFMENKMEVLEKLYLLAVKYKTCFNYHRQSNGSFSVALLYDNLLLRFDVVGELQFSAINDKEYNTISEAMEDFESLILLKR